MTPRHAQPQQQQLAEELVDLLATRHNIPADALPLPCGVVVSVFAGLVAHVGHVIWWTVPDVTGARERPLTTYASTPVTAADRLAEHYRKLRSVPLADLLSAGYITPVAAGLLDEMEARHAVVPV